MDVNVADISGKISLRDALGGALGLNGISGDTNFPKIIDRTAIHYDTKEAWDSDITFVGEAGHFYVYSDYSKKTLQDGTEINVPAVKIGDGSAYLIDIPFITGDTAERLEEHINNMTIHVSPPDRTNWDNKVTADVDGDKLVLSI